MRITMFAHGLRGDVWPTVALGYRLQERDHDVTVAIPGEFRQLGERAGLRVVPLPFDMTTWLTSREGQRLLATGGLRLMRGFGNHFSRHAEELDEAHASAAEGAEALVGGLITLDRAVALADRHRIPVTMLSQYPVAPSAAYPAINLVSGSLGLGMLNRASGHFGYWVWRKSNARANSAFRCRLGLPAERGAPFYRLNDHSCPILHTVSRHLFPRPADWGENLAITGGWRMPAALRERLGEELPTDLDEWLDAGEPPVFLGFGSMPVLEPAATLQLIVTVTEELGIRAIVSQNCIPPGAALPEHLHAVRTVDHDALFPRCAAIVHHGGLGSTLASLRAGRPTMVCSVFNDQPWWGERVRRLGVGVHLPFRKLDRPRLECGLKALREPRCQARAWALGLAIKTEGDGLPPAAELFEDWLVTAEPAPATAFAS
jgi:sterol 3beta-glucosyltransferase